MPWKYATESVMVMVTNAIHERIPRNICIVAVVHVWQKGGNVSRMWPVVVVVVVERQEPQMPRIATLRDALVM